MIDTEETRAVRVAERHVTIAAADATLTLTRVAMVPPRGSEWIRLARRSLLRGVVALIYAPAAAILLAGALAAAGLLGDLWRLGRAVATHSLGTLPDTYDRLALAARVALVSGAFLVLLCALVVVAVGCRGRRWWRLYLIPGVPLSVVATLLVLFAIEWCSAAANQLLGWSPPVWETLTALALADAVLVAARVGGIGAGPLGTRRARRRGQRAAGRASTRSGRQTQPIPVVRFGPRITAVPTPDLPAEERISASAPLVDAPTAEELRAAAGHAPGASAPPVSAPVAANTAAV